MSLFGAIDTATSGANVSRVWLDAISDNVANINTDVPGDQEPFRARMVRVAAVDRADNGTGGARVVAINDRPGDPALVYDPTNPIADARGLVAKPVVDLSVEMTNLLIANRSYQANLRVVEHARDTYRSALQIGAR